MKTKKELKKEYKTKKFKAGIFQIINKKENRIFLKATPDLERGFNSDLFQLNAGNHFNKNLQDDWNKFGQENFEVKIYDELKTEDTATSADITQDLKELLELHMNELKSNGRLMY